MSVVVSYSPYTLQQPKKGFLSFLHRENPNLEVMTGTFEILPEAPVSGFTPASKAFLERLELGLFYHTIHCLTANGKDLEIILDSFTNIPRPINPKKIGFTWNGDMAKTILMEILRMGRYCENLR